MISISFCVFNTVLIHRCAFAYKNESTSLWALAKNKKGQTYFLVGSRKIDTRRRWGRRKIGPKTQTNAHTRNNFPSAPQVRHVWGNNPRWLALCVKLLARLWCEIVRDSLIFCLNGSLRWILAGWRRFTFQRNIDCSGALSYTRFFHSLSICTCVLEKSTKWILWCHDWPS